MAFDVGELLRSLSAASWFERMRKRCASPSDPASCGWQASGGTTRPKTAKIAQKMRNSPEMAHRLCISAPSLTARTTTLLI